MTANRKTYAAWMGQQTHSSVAPRIKACGFVQIAVEVDGKLVMERWGEGERVASSRSESCGYLFFESSAIADSSVYDAVRTMGNEPVISASRCRDAHLLTMRRQESNMVGNLLVCGRRAWPPRGVDLMTQVVEGR